MKFWLIVLLILIPYLFLIAGCKPDRFKCHNGKCIHREYTCNEINDCGDFSDEQKCGCKPDQFTCRNKECIPIKYYCNGFADCSDSSDEDHDMCKGNVDLWYLVPIEI